MRGLAALIAVLVGVFVIVTDCSQLIHHPKCATTRCVTVVK